jgi:hypothetical protein
MLAPLFFVDRVCLLLAAVALLAAGLNNESLGLLAAIARFLATVAAVTGFSGLLPVGNAVQATGVPRRELHGTGLFDLTTRDSLSSDGSRCRGLGDCGGSLQNANGAVIGMGGGREGKQAKNSKNRLHINSLNVFAEVFGDKSHYSRIRQKSKMPAKNVKMDNVGCGSGGMG